MTNEIIKKIIEKEIEIQQNQEHYSSIKSSFDGYGKLLKTFEDIEHLFYSLEGGVGELWLDIEDKGFIEDDLINLNKDIENLIIETIRLGVISNNFMEFVKEKNNEDNNNEMGK